jgi:hypothetical protein
MLAAIWLLHYAYKSDIENFQTTMETQVMRRLITALLFSASDRNQQAFHYNVVAFGKQGYFAKPLQTGTRIKLVVQAQSQPDNIATLPLLTATLVQPVRPVAVAPN